MNSLFGAISHSMNALTSSITGRTSNASKERVVRTGAQPEDNVLAPDGTASKAAIDALEICLEEAESRERSVGGEVKSTPANVLNMLLLCRAYLCAAETSENI